MSASIEFLGMPGSGKSTLAAHVKRDLGERGLGALSLEDALARHVGQGVGDRLIDPLMSILPRRLRNRYAESAFIRSPAFFRGMVQFAAAYPGAMSAFLRGQARRSEFEVGGELVINWFLQLVARYQFVHESILEDEVLLLDEGFCQRVLTGFGVGFSEDDHADVEDYLASIPEPDLLVYFVPDIELVSGRLVRASEGADPTGRKSIYGTKRLEGSGIDPRRFLEDCARAVEFVIDTALRRRWSAVAIDSSDGLEVSAERAGSLIAGVVRREAT